MSGAFWRGLFELRDGVDRATRLVAQGLDEGHRDGESTNRSAMLLSSLHLEVRDALERCTGSMEMYFLRLESSWAVDRVLRLLAFWLNERIRRLLPEQDRADWEPVGPVDVDLRNGGRQFFVEADRLLSELERAPVPRAAGGAAAATETLADVALFCLEQGFAGEHADSGRTLQGYKERLRRPPIQTVASPEGDATPSRLSFAPMAASALGAILSFYLLCALAMEWMGGG